ncbi:MAG: OadG family protein [Proteobacteria bacterium]|jgi:oxaloacetate decarboxylase gamma subunit|nr:OadG family protein [Pseudomonadota bacterium]
MNIDQLLKESFHLLGLGMGAVFIILILLIGIITLVSKLVPEELPVEAAPTRNSSTPVDNQHIAVIQAAVHKFRKSRGS